MNLELTFGLTGTSTAMRGHIQCTRASPTEATSPRRQRSILSLELPAALRCTKVCRLHLTTQGCVVLPLSLSPSLPLSLSLSLSLSVSLPLSLSLSLCVCVCVCAVLCCECAVLCVQGFTRIAPSWSAFRSNTFGYSRMLVHNTTHLHWQQVSTDPTSFPLSEYGKVIDDAWIIQPKHGPFSAANAPTGTAHPIGDESTHRTLDHWTELLGFPAASGNRPASFHPARIISPNSFSTAEQRLSRRVGDDVAGP
jgi:hypothetical protein